MRRSSLMFLNQMQSDLKMRLYLLLGSYTRATGSDPIAGDGQEERLAYKAGQGKMLHGSSSGLGFMLESQ